MKKFIFVLLVLILLFGCKDLTAKNDLYGVWINRNVESTAYDNKILAFYKFTKEEKKEFGSDFDGTYKTAYVMGTQIVEDSILTGKFKYRSSYIKDKKAFVNGIEMSSENEELLPQSFEFYFDGTLLMFIDRSASVPTFESYLSATMIDGF